MERKIPFASLGKKRSVRWRGVCPVSCLQASPWNREQQLSEGTRGPPISPSVTWSEGPRTSPEQAPVRINPAVRTLLRQSLLFSVPRHLSAPQGCVGPRGEALMAGGRRPSTKVTPAGPETWAETQRCRRPVRPSGAHVCHKGLQETNVDCLSARQATSS